MLPNKPLWKECPECGVVVGVKAFQSHKCSEELVHARQTAAFRVEWRSEEDGMRFYWKKLEDWLLQPQGQFALYLAGENR